MDCRANGELFVMRSGRFVFVLQVVSIIGSRSTLIRNRENCAIRKLASDTAEKNEATNAVASPTLT